MWLFPAQFKFLRFFKRVKELVFPLPKENCEVCQLLPKEQNFDQRLRNFLQRMPYLRQRLPVLTHFFILPAVIVCVTTVGFYGTVRRGARSGSQAASIGAEAKRASSHLIIGSINSANPVTIIVGSVATCSQ
jgi:hypothetical protein